MKLDLKFKENNQRLDLKFGQFQALTDGGYERGYAAGYEVGNSEGYTKGHTEGAEQGLTEGEARMIEGNANSVINDRVITVRSSAFTSGFIFNLKYVYFKNAKKVENSAFSNCRVLEEVYLDNVTSIGNNAFYLNVALKKLVIRTPTICTLGNAFTNNSLANENGKGFIYFPDNLVEQYKVATNWSAVAHKIKPLSELGE